MEKETVETVKTAKISFVGTLEESSYGGRKTINMLIEDFVSEKSVHRNSLW